jgi:hypothetical protein
VPEAHAYNPSYSGGRDQEDNSSKSTQANSLCNPISKKKKKSQKRAGGVAQYVGLEFKPQNLKKEKKCKNYKEAIYSKKRKFECISVYSSKMEIKVTDIFHS